MLPKILCKTEQCGMCLANNNHHNNHNHYNNNHYNNNFRCGKWSKDLLEISGITVLYYSSVTIAHHLQRSVR